MIFNPGVQQTLNGETWLEGVGIHSGVACKLRVAGAPAGTGIVFKSAAGSVRATPENVVDVRRGTTIGSGAMRVICVEHLLAALAGSGIDNAECELTGPELPALDGSSIPYVRAFAKTGISAQEQERQFVKIDKLSCVTRGSAAATMSPSDTLEMSYLLRYDHAKVGLQYRQFKPRADDFGSELASARTFGRASEAEELRSQGLALGASTENAVVLFDDDHVEPDLRFSDEFVRHKLLDMVGDLSLAGTAISGTILGVATGHWANVELAKQIKGRSFR